MDVRPLLLTTLLVTGTACGEKTEKSGGSRPAEDKAAAAPAMEPAAAEAASEQEPTEGRRPVVGSVKLGPVDVYGPHDATAVEKIVRYNEVRLRVCYEQVLEQAPEFWGVTRIQIIIAENGQVAEVTPEVTPNNAAMDSCVRSQLGGLKFPTADAISDVRTGLRMSRR